MPVAVRGLRELNAAFAKADRETRRGVRVEQAKLAEPVRLQAETLALAQIPRIGTRWSRMRTGVTTRLVYVAPKERGAKTNARRRPNLAGLLMDRAMEPALEAHRPEFEQNVERMLDEIAAKFNRGGAL